MVVLVPAESAQLLFSPCSSSLDLRFAMTNLGFVYSVMSRAQVQSNFWSYE